MKSYATVFYAVAAAQGVLAKLPEGQQLAPDRLPALQDDHVAKVQVPSKMYNACYQNSGGQVLERGPDGKPTKVLKYPCISAQEIFGYCQKAAFNNDVKAQKECLFGKSSTLESDYEGCVKCEVYNGIGTAEYHEATRQRIKKVKEEFMNPKNTKKFSDIDSQFQMPDWKKGTPVKAQVETAANGTTDINILSYWKDYVLPQQAGAPEPTGKDVAPVAPKEPAQWETIQKTISVGFYAALSIQSTIELTGSAKFRNDSSGGAERGFVWFEQVIQLGICIDNAAPGLEISVESRLEISAQLTVCNVVEQKALQDTFQVYAATSVQAVDLLKVSLDIDMCSCVEVENIKIEKNGKTFVPSIPAPQPQTGGKTPEAPKTPSTDGKTPSSNGQAPSQPSGSNGQAPSQPPSSNGQAPSTKAGGASDSAGSTAPGNNGSGARPVAPPAPVTPSTPASNGASGARNSTAAVTVSGGSAMRASSLLVAVGALVAAL